MNDLLDSVEEKIKEWDVWFDNVSTLTLPQLKKGAEYWENESELFLHNKKSIQKKDHLQWVENLAMQRFLYEFTFMAYKLYSRRLETEFRKKKKERKK